MSTVIRHKRGTSDPAAGDFSETAELLVNTTDGGLFTKTDGGSVVEIGAGGGGGLETIESGDTAETFRIGTDALSQLTTSGNQSFAAGYQALQNATTGASRSIAIGYKALNATTYGDDNIAFGGNALLSNTTGVSNIAIGLDACKNNTTSYYNIAIGRQALENNTTAHYNLAIGYRSLLDNTTGGKNGAFGASALTNNTTGEYNSAHGYAALQNNTTGSQNVAMGGFCLSNSTTGSFNIGIGYYAQSSSPTASYEITLGGTSITKFRVPGINFILKDNGSTPSTGQVLTADSSGEGYWADAAANTTISGNTIWHAGNDGSGSGLDADTLDGQEGNYYLDYNNLNNTPSIPTNYLPLSGGTLTGTLTLGSNTINDVEDIYLRDKIYHDGDTDTYIQFHAANQFRVVTGGAERFEVNQGTTKVTGNISVSGTVDGRDVAADGTKLDGIASGATNVTNNNQLTNGAGYITSADGGNADTVDGLQASSFLRSDTSDTATGELTFNGRVNIRGHLDLSDGENLDFGSSDDVRISYNSNNWLYTNFRTSEGIIFQDNGSNKMRLEDSGIFRPESNNTGTIGTSSYYWDNGYFQDFNVSGTINVRGAIDLADNDILRLGSGDDAEFFCDGSHFYLDLNSEIGNFYIRDGSTTRFTFDDDGSFTATGNVTAYSDINLKKNIEVIPNALDKVMQIRGVTFDRKDIETSRQSGVIAQEIEKVLPEVVDTNEEGIKSVAYGNLVGLLIEAIKEQQVQIKELKTLVNLK